MYIQTNKNLTRLNTFKINVKCKYFVEISSENDFLELIKTDEFKNNKKYILGGGSNTLFTEDFDGLVIHNKIMGKKITKQDKNEVFVEVGAGEERDEIIRRALDKNWYGMENLVSIPGFVGATAVQNIGAYGVEAKDIIQEVKYINFNGYIYTKKTSDCNFSYRNSYFKSCDNCFIMSVTFKFNTNLKSYKSNISYKSLEKYIKGGENPKQIAKIISDIRESKLPDWKKIGTAGSFFKNPIVSINKFKNMKKNNNELPGFELPNGQVKLFAGYLLDAVIGKGYRDGAVGTYNKHALVLVNYGDAKGEEMLKFVKFIQKKVKDKFAVNIEPEVVFV